MGNCCSDNAPVNLTDFVNRPSDPEDILTAEKISEGLTRVAAVLNKAKKNVRIVAVGGAVNALLLRSRASTADVDFFYRTKTTNNDVSSIVLAAEKVAKDLRISKGWLNNHTAVFLEVIFLN
jgi:predicted nucleotidyltransferase